jgi:hypothetical protein
MRDKLWGPDLIVVVAIWGWTLMLDKSMEAVERSKLVLYTDNLRKDEMMRMIWK